MIAETERCEMPDCDATRVVYTYPDGTIGVAEPDGGHMWPA